MEQSQDQVAKMQKEVPKQLKKVKKREVLKQDQKRVELKHHQLFKMK